MKKMIVSLMLIISMFAFAAESAPSATVGYVKYDCTAARSFVALPMQDTYTNASTLSTNFNAVSKYNSATQAWVTASKGFLGWTGDFAVTAGQAYWVNSTTAGTFIVDDEVVTNPAYNLVLGRNAVMVPLTKASTMDTAADYGTETGNVVNAVSKYNSTTQAWVTASKGFLGWTGDFAIGIADPHWVNATGSLTWPSTKVDPVDGEAFVTSSPKADPKTITLGMLDPLGAEYTAANIGGVTFKAWMTSRPTEIIRQTGNGCFVEMYFGVRGVSKVDLQNFTTPYAIGDQLNVLMKDENGGLKAYFEGLRQYTLVSIDGSMVELGFEDLGLPGSGMPTVLNTPSSIDEMVPTETKLHQNYPNPFNPATTIKFDLATAGNVKLNVYNYNGQLLQSLVNGTMNAGVHSVDFDASSLSAGVYYYTLEAGNSIMSNKMILVK